MSKHVFVYNLKIFMEVKNSQSIPAVARNRIGNLSDERFLNIWGLKLWIKHSLFSISYVVVVTEAIYSTRRTDNTDLLCIVCPFLFPLYNVTHYNLFRTCNKTKRPSFY